MHCAYIRIAFPCATQAISRMRTILVSLLTAYSTVATLAAGRLDVAVIQFPEEKAPAELENALAKVNLFELTNADRTRTTQSYLKGGSVLFAQRLSVSPGSRFWTATRLKNASAEVEGRLEAGGVSVSISLMEGVRAGLRTFQKKVYVGSGPLPPGPPRLLAVRQLSGRFPSIVKGQAKMDSYHQTIVVVAQHAP
jgi:hypothetical protein